MAIGMLVTKMAFTEAIVDMNIFQLIVSGLTIAITLFGSLVIFMVLFKICSFSYP